MKKIAIPFSLALVLSFSLLNGFAQLFDNKSYPQNYFVWPVDAKIAIVANFGELRPNHYHMGLDCRTDQKENVRVLASAPGYIAKVKIEPFGFGRCIYINHPNGFTTLYAHLNNFNPALEKYVTEQQYKQKSWRVFLDIPANLFPVNQGDFIAYSGNTGGSQGPHVHFEIRETKTDKVLNPLLFNMPLEDRIAPDVLRLAVYDRTKSTYEQTPRYIPIRKLNGVYSPVSGMVNVNSSKASFAITAYDRYNGANNQNGIYEATLYDNDKAVCGFRMNNISYDETRYLNAHIDYKTRSNGGPFLQHLSRLPGYTNGIYSGDGSDGVIDLTAGETHAVKIIVADAAGNKSQVNFMLNSTATAAPAAPAMSSTRFQPGAVNIFENSNASFYLPENYLYDSFNFIYHETPAANGKTIFQLHNPSVPLQGYFTIKLKDHLLYAASDKMVMQRFYGGKKDYVKAVFEKGWYKATFREFGNFQLMIDEEPPVVNAVGFRDNMNAAGLKRLVFSVSDNTEEINSFTALLDGNWLRFSNDKGRNFIYNFDEYCGSGAHELKIRVEDQVGNVTERTYHFTR